MARQQQSATRTRTSRSQTTDPALRDPVAGLKYRYRHELELLRKLPVGAERGEEWPEHPQYQTGRVFQDTADEIGITLPELHSRRRFAFLYSEEDLQRLCSYQPLLSWSAIRWLLRVETREQRRKLEAEAVAKKWTASRLKERVRKEAGTRGRHPKLPSGAADGVRLLSEQSQRLEWLLKTLVLDKDSLLGPAKARTETTRTQRRKLQSEAKKVAKVLEQFHGRLAGL